MGRFAQRARFASLCACLVACRPALLAACWPSAGRFLDGGAQPALSICDAHAAVEVLAPEAARARPLFAFQRLRSATFLWPRLPRPLGSTGCPGGGRSVVLSFSVLIRHTGGPWYSDSFLACLLVVRQVKARPSRWPVQCLVVRWPSPPRFRWHCLGQSPRYKFFTALGSPACPCAGNASARTLRQLSGIAIDGTVVAGPPGSY